MLVLQQENTICLVDQLVSSMAPIEGLDPYDMHEQESKTMIMKDLLADNYDEVKYDVKLEVNNAIIRDVFRIVSHLPKFITVTQTKPIIPTFEPIPVFDSDSAEIQKFIRKVNYDMVGYHCNHNAIDEKCDKIFKNISDLFDTSHWQTYQEFMESCCSQIRYVLRMYERDSNLGYKRETDRFHVPYSGMKSQSLFKVKNAILHINAIITEINAKTNKRCSKCESMQRKRDYCLSEIERMRRIKAEQDEIDRSFGESKYNLTEFMDKNYPRIDRFLLKDVQEKFQQTFKIRKTFDQLTQEIEATGKFKVTNVHRTYFVNRK